MAIIAPTPVANLPTPPNPNQAEADFDTAAYNWSNDLNRWTGDTNDLASNVYNNATEAQSAASTATTQAGAASSSASAAASSASTATTKANEADASAISAAASASTATTKAAEAATSASSASASATTCSNLVASIAGGPVASVNGQTGPTVTLTAADVGAVTASGVATLTNKTIESGVFTNGYTEETYAPAAGSSFTFDFANGTIQGYTTNANTTITLPAVVAGKSFSIQISFGGAHTLTWAGGTIAWAGNTVPSFSGASGKTDTISFMANVAGTKWIGTAFALGSAT